VQIESFSGSRAVTTPGAAASGGGAGSSTAGAQVGSVTFSVTGTGGLPAAAAWLDGLEHDPSLQGTWLPGVTVGTPGDQVTFTSNSNLTTHARSDRSKGVQ